MASASPRVHSMASWLVEELEHDISGVEGLAPVLLFARSADLGERAFRTLYGPEHEWGDESIG